MRTYIQINPADNVVVAVKNLQTGVSLDINGRTIVVLQDIPAGQQQGTFMDMMYMPDGLRAAIEIMEADSTKFVHRNSFNIASMSFDPEIIYNNIKKYVPDFQMEYDVDPLRQAIAESWPNSLDDTCAREEWGWKPEYDLDSMTQDMLAKLKERFNK